MQQLVSIHYLRAIAAVMVVLFHIYSLVPQMHQQLQSMRWLQSGVDIFFVISGFVMVESTQRQSVSPTSFLIRRAIRIIPIYWLFTILMLAFSAPGRTSLFIPSMFFIPMQDPTSGLFEPLLQVGWTLNFEILFYVIFACCLTLKGSKKLITVGIMLYALTMASVFLPSNKILGFYSNSMIFEFWLGMLLASYRHFARPWMLPLGAVLIAALPHYFEPRLVHYGLGAFFIVAGLCALEKQLREWRWAMSIGDASYAIYLVHLFCIAVTYGLFGGAVTNFPIEFIAAAMTCSILIGVLVHWFIEKPIVKYLKQIVVIYSSDLTKSQYLT
jgi:exopolysaccharide production protein ExoZ